MTDHVLSGFGEVFKWNESLNVEHFVGMTQVNHESTIDMLACHINLLV
jgi:hypothetical protein